MTPSQVALAESKFAISIPGFAKSLDVGLSTAKGLITRGEVESIRIGRRRLVVVDSIRDYIARLARQ